VAFGGVTREVLFDNMKTVVLERNTYGRGLSGIVCGGSYASPLGARGTYDDPRRDH